MQLVCVPPDQVAPYWPLAERYIREAMEHDPERTGDDVAFDVHSARALLWLAVENNKVAGAAVTQLALPAGWIVAFGSEDMKRALPLIEGIKRHFRQEGCTKIRICGRPGWQRMLPDLRPVAVLLEGTL